MTRRALLRSWFVKPPLGGKWALLWIIASLPITVLIRSTMNCPDPVGECCTPFLILTLVTAVLLGSWSAVAAAIAAAGVSYLLFVPAPGMPMGHDGGELFGLLLYCFFTGAIIWSVAFTRRTFARYSRIAADEKASGVIFSSEDGQAWVSWPGSPSPLRLGPSDEVSEMMADFVAQAELGQRLARSSERETVS